LRALSSLSKHNEAGDNDNEPTNTPPEIMVASSVKPAPPISPEALAALSTPIPVVDAVASAPHPLSLLRTSSEARDSVNSWDHSLNSPIHEFQRLASELAEPAESEHSEADDFIPDLSAPCVLPKNVNGRLQVTARTVIMEVPHYFKGASAALKMLTKVMLLEEEDEDCLDLCSSECLPQPFVFMLAFFVCITSLVFSIFDLITGPEASSASASRRVPT
jgi:hypothetical protein